MKDSPEKASADFIHQSEFVEWVLRPTDELNQYWENYLAENPLETGRIKLAKQLIISIIPKEKALDEVEVNILWNKINESAQSRKRTIISIRRWSVAASILMVIGLSGWFLSVRKPTKIDEINYHSIVVQPKSGNDIKLILADKSEEIFSTKEVDLKYNKEGLLITNSGRLVTEESVDQMQVTEKLNQLVVPYGKRSKIELADGTKLWLNSGSRAIYPVVFKKDKREIFIEGEGYLEVAHDASKPFYVVTDQMKIRVLGTKFDLSTYKDDATISVVLVEGSVEATSEREKMILKPNQLLSYHKSTQESTISRTNVLEYVSWIDGWMLCEREKLTSIFTKLSRYYDVRIDVSDPKFNDMTLTGKLDLKSNCEEVLKVICSTAPLDYAISENQITLIVREK
jgi:ferric-dicitrate binding protein FerR (iron transport regulator)